MSGAGGRYVSIARSELGAIIYRALGGRVETIFGDSVRALDDAMHIDADTLRMPRGSAPRAWRQRDTAA